MRNHLVLAAVAGAALACSQAGDSEVIVTREHFGEAWPLEVNSARVECSEAGGKVLRLGPRRYALDEAARAQGLPDATDVARRQPDPEDPAHGSVPADLRPLAEACDVPADVASGP